MVEKCCESLTSQEEELEYICRCTDGSLYWQEPRCHRPSGQRQSTERVSPGKVNVSEGDV